MKDQKNSRAMAQKLEHSVKNAILALLQINEIRFHEIQYEQGCAYLKMYLNNDEYSVAVMERSKIFWTWWRNHWMNRDETFLSLHKKHPIKRVEFIRQLYAQYNKGTMLAKSIHPNAVVLNESYALMVTEFVSSETQKQTA